MSNLLTEIQKEETLAETMPGDWGYHPRMYSSWDTHVDIYYAVSYFSCPTYVASGFYAVLNE